MKLLLVLGAVALSILVASSKQQDQQQQQVKSQPDQQQPANPFLVEWDTPFGVPPFDKIELVYYQPAFDEAMRQHNEEIDAVLAISSAPTFANTIEALERSGALLSRVSNVFFAMNSSLTNEDMQEIAKVVAPELSKHEDEILLNDKLFQRVKSVYEQKDALGLNPEQLKLLDECYKGFVRGGANLDDKDKARLTEINGELSKLSLQFGENVLKENNKFEMVVENETDLSGLPEAVITAAKETAKERGHEGKWVFTLHKPSMIPFIQYSDKRDLREKIYKAYYSRGNNGDELDNKKILARMAALRAERAKLLGYETHAHYVLEDNMAKEPKNVYELLGKLWSPALKRATVEAAEMQQMIDQEGGDFKLATWDWWYYAEKVKKAKYDLDEEMLRPYFKLENVRQGVFDVAGALFGLRFEERSDIPKYHEDVTVFEVKEADGSQVCILYVDYFPRASKRGGAWMGEFRQQSKQEGKNIRPIIYNVGNFTKPTSSEPSLLSFDEVNTLFHEFGHALHGMLSDCTYETLAGTEVSRDFVELPSQLMENWASDPQVLKMYARHYQTGEPMPDELIEKIKKSRHFNQGFATTEYLAASFLDLDWHTLDKAREVTDVLAFEDECLSELGLIPEIISRYRSPYFRHIFAGGYSSGYYSYVWAEVLDADAFQAFKEAGDIFDAKTAKSFRENVLERGGTEDAMVLYTRFRGQDPSIEPLLERRGLK
jgi:peptidyl-dipeptidase Dcp